MSRLSLLSARAKQWVIGKEVGDSGTPHLQCYFQFPNQTRFATLKRAIPNGHWEKAKGNAQQNLAYCSKDGDYTTNIAKKWTLEEMKQMVRAEYKNVTWRPWQQSVLDDLVGDRSSRTVHWIFEPTGNTGKSFLAKYLVLAHSAILCSGKSTDVLHAVAKAVEAGVLPRLIIFDVPRVSAQYLSFTGLELIKNGCCHSSKYEGAQLLFPNPAVICFANSMPDREKLSKDRWRIWEIKDNKLFSK